jgi:hypothetical protein
MLKTLLILRLEKFIPELAREAINPQTGEFYPGIGAGGSINPQTGQIYPGTGGNINPNTGMPDQ